MQLKSAWRLPQRWQLWEMVANHQKPSLDASQLHQYLSDHDKSKKCSRSERLVLPDEMMQTYSFNHQPQVIISSQQCQFKQFKVIQRHHCWVAISIGCLAIAVYRNKAALWAACADWQCSSADVWSVTKPVLLWHVIWQHRRLQVTTSRTIFLGSETTTQLTKLP